MPPEGPRHAPAAAAFLALLCLAPSSHAATPALAIPGGTLRVTERGAATVLDITQHGHHAHLVLPAEGGIHPRSLDAAKLIGAIPGRVLILSIDYASNPAGGSSMCGAGTETMLRIIALRPAPRQTFRQRTTSCWNSIESDEIHWSGPGTLTVDRLTVTPEVRHLRTQYHVAPDGTVTPGKVEQLP